MENKHIRAHNETKIMRKFMKQKAEMPKLFDFFGCGK